MQGKLMETQPEVSAGSTRKVSTGRERDEKRRSAPARPGRVSTFNQVQTFTCLFLTAGLHSHPRDWSVALFSFPVAFICASVHGNLACGRMCLKIQIVHVSIIKWAIFFIF
jgi:hypothetical protein